MMTMVTYQAVNGFGSGHDGFCSSHLSLYPFVDWELWNEMKLLLNASLPISAVPEKFRIFSLSQ